jgi:hypothetical protein
VAEVTDPDGVQWSVRRRRWYDMSGSLSGVDGNSLGDNPLLGLLLLPLFFVAWWPVWFIAHWLGLKWKIVIERDGTEVGDEQVRGWRKSQRRIQEIAELAAAGTLRAKPAVPVRNFAGSAPQPPPINTYPTEDPVTSRMPVNEEPTRCLLSPNPELAQQTGLARSERTRLAQASRQPSLALDVGADAIRVIDLNTNALIASASPAQVTATPETYRYRSLSWRSPVLVVDAPGWQPLTITCVDRVDNMRLTPRFSWRGEAPERWDKPAAYMVSGRDWLTLVEKCGLARYLERDGQQG